MQFHLAYWLELLGFLGGPSRSGYRIFWEGLMILPLDKLEDRRRGCYLKLGLTNLLNGIC